MHQLGLEYLSVFGLHPVVFVELGARLNYDFVSLNLAGPANCLAPHAPLVPREDAALRRDVARALRSNGMRLAMVEGFAITPNSSAEHLFAEFDMAAEMGAASVCVIDLERDRQRSPAEFAKAAEAAAERGLIVTTEVGAGRIRDLTAGAEAIAAVGHPAFKLLLDTMHFFRLGSTVAELSALDPAIVGHVQLNDVPMPAVRTSYMEEALFERRAPGDGDLPLADFLAALAPDVPIGLEVPIRSEFDAGIGHIDRLERSDAGARAVLAAARRPTTSIRRRSKLAE
jgi:sugar phosphate isomerase/epimerase